jgi:GNAT superfamily N-acetyltransferase
LDLTIREATPGDLGAVLEIYRDSGLDAEAGFGEDEARLVFEKMKAYPSYAIYIAETDGTACGTFSLLIMDTIAHGGTPSGIVEAVAVNRSSQGKGVGKAMMRFAMKRCRALGCYKVMLCSNEKRTDAHKFYESLGFTRHGFSYSVPV